jgi:membrane associated rhomboid family serine protease
MPSLTPVTLLIVSVVAVSIVGLASKAVRAALILHPMSVRERFQVHRLLTAGWVHADPTHLAFNMLTLHFFANDAVKNLGVVRFLVLYVSAVVVAYVPTTLRHMRSPRYTSLGASGAVAAVMFSAILLRPKLTLSLMLLPIPIPGYVYALGYLAYSAYRSYRSSDGINHDAHFSGAVYGAALTFVFEPARVQRGIAQLFS